MSVGVAAETLASPWGRVHNNDGDLSGLAAALATLLQVAYADVPDPRIDERLAAGEHPNALDEAILGLWAAP
jgi:hypothetical protein